jgi:hypothetical protein
MQGALALLVVGAVEQAARAQAPRAVRLEYDAPPACADEASFQAQVRARSARVIFASDGGTALRVRIGARGARFEGDVSLGELHGPARRHVEGSCEDVTAALALIAALALDPMASTASDPAGASSASAPPAASTAPPPPAPTASAATSPPPKKTDERRLADAEPLSEAEERAHGWGWSIGAEAAITQGVAPSALVTVPAFLDVSRRGPTVFTPAVRLRFERADSASSAAQGGAYFTWTAGSLDLCPVSLSTWRVRVWPCARAEAGVLAATGAETTPVRSDSRPWMTLGLVARARVTVVGALFVELEGGAFAPLVRDRFFVEPDTTVERVPAVAAAGAAGGGVTFW